MHLSPITELDLTEEYETYMKGNDKMLALKTGDSFFEIDFSRKCYAANRSSVTLYKLCFESSYINLGKVFEGTIMECKQFVYDNIAHFDNPAEHYFGNYPALVQQCGSKNSSVL